MSFNLSVNNVTNVTSVPVPPPKKTACELAREFSEAAANCGQNTWTKYGAAKDCEKKFYQHQALQYACYHDAMETVFSKETLTTLVKELRNSRW